MKGSFDRQKSLQELEQDNWGEPPYNSYLVTTIHRLRRKPLAEFATEDLRIMIGQRIGLPFLIPLVCPAPAARATSNHSPGNCCR